MSKRDWKGIEEDADPQMNVRVPAELLNEVDNALDERGFTSRSEFVRMAIRDALNPRPKLSKETLKQIEESKTELDEGEYVTADDL